MSFNKNGLEIKLNFEHSLKDKDLDIIQDIGLNEYIIQNNISTIFFPSKPNKIIELQKYSMNFPIISIKQHNELIINKILDFVFSGMPQNIRDNNNINLFNKSSLPPPPLIKPRQNFQIINIDKINLSSLNQEIKEEIIQKPIIKEYEKDKKVFSNLNIFIENNLFIKGEKREKEIKKIEKNEKIEIYSKINDIEILGKPKDKKIFDNLKSESKITNIEVNGKIFEKKFNILKIESKLNNIEINKSETKKAELKILKSETLEIKSYKKEKNLSIENNIIKLEIIRNKKPELFIQNNIIELELIHNNKNIKYQIAKNIISFEIKSQQKKKGQEILFKKVDNFLRPNEKVLYRNKITKKVDIVMDSRDTKNPKLDIYKTKSPNQIIINRATPKEININNNNYGNRLYFIEENKSMNNLHNEMMGNKESAQIPIFNDIVHLEKQYEKIKKDLNELYPVFSKNKQYRENYFVQLSQGNQDKYNFYLNLYKIIKDEQEEKKNNNYDNYLKMKTIIDGKSSGNKKKIKPKLKPLKKNYSSCSIVARNKLFPAYTEENHYY